MRARRPPRTPTDGRRGRHRRNRGNRGPRRRERGGDRGQTTIDFAVGATLFLLTMAFVFTFVPVMFQPFSTSQTDPLVADRVANRLATDVLGDPAEPYVLDETCTEVFFNGSDPDSYGCYHPDPVFDPGEHPNLVLGVENDTRINVTLVDASGSVVEDVGTPTENAADVITAQRRVLYDGRSHELYVRVW